MARSKVAVVSLLIELMAILLTGCLSVYIGPPRVATLKVDSVPEGALVSLRKYVPPPPAGINAGPVYPEKEYFAKGNTPYQAKIDQGRWQMKVEAPGYEPVEVLLDVQSRQPLTYRFELQKLDGVSPKE